MTRNNTSAYMILHPHEGNLADKCLPLLDKDKQYLEEKRIVLLDLAIKSWNCSSLHSRNELKSRLSSIKNKVISTFPDAVRNTILNLVGGDIKLSIATYIRGPDHRFPLGYLNVPERISDSEIVLECSLLFAPPEVVRYYFAHECAHLYLRSPDQNASTSSPFESDLTKFEKSYPVAERHEEAEVEKLLKDWGFGSSSGMVEWVDAVYQKQSFNCMKEYRLFRKKGS